MDIISKVISTARAEVGQVTDPSTMDNKYNQWYYGGPVRNANLHWCVVFLGWCMHRLGLDDLFCGGHKTASTNYVMSWAKTHGRWVTGDYKPGDFLLFDWSGTGRADHIGLLVEANGGTYKTIEGNTTSGSNKSTVAEKTRYAKNVLGAYRPDYPVTVEAADWAKKAWDSAVAKKIMDGTNPQGTVTREMLAVVLANLGLV